MEDKGPDQLIQYLPAVYQGASPESLLVNLLKAFEKLLLGRNDDALAEKPRLKGLEETIAGLARYSDPEYTDPEFLPWLAGWVGLTLRADLTVPRQRKVISRIVPLYRVRGTKHGLEDMIWLFTEGKAEITEPEDLEFQIKDHSTIGKDTYLGGPAPHRFDVRFTPPLAPGDGPKEPALRDQRLEDIVRWVIEMAKPAHTGYTLEMAETAERPETESQGPQGEGGAMV